MVCDLSHIFPFVGFMGGANQFSMVSLRIMRADIRVLKIIFLDTGFYATFWFEHVTG